MMNNSQATFDNTQPLSSRISHEMQVGLDFEIDASSRAEAEAF